MCLTRNLVNVFRDNNNNIRTFYNPNCLSNKTGLVKDSYFSGIINKIETNFYDINEKKLKDLCFKERIGYKIYARCSNNELHAFQGYWLKNKWYESNISIIEDDNYEKYISGFHILWSREDARKYKKKLDWSNIGIYKVLYNEIIHLGIDDNCQVAIARKMKILKKI